MERQPASPPPSLAELFQLAVDAITYALRMQWPEPPREAPKNDAGRRSL